MLGACSINKVILMGRLTSNPELRQTFNGVNTCHFYLAVTRNYQEKNGERQSDFISVVAWRQTAEFICRYFGKGQLILVEGEIRTRSYDDTRYPDVKHYVTEIYADNVNFGETKTSRSQSTQTPQNAPQTNGSGTGGKTAPPQTKPLTDPNLSDFDEVISDGDLPF